MKAKKETVVRTPGKPDKHFRMDKSWKRLMALGNFPVAVKISDAENSRRETPLVAGTQSDAKKAFIAAQLTHNESRYSGLRDPLWKQAKERDENAVSTDKNEKKGKKHRKMRKTDDVVTPVA
jgi:hypothetical protein